jgi:CheY-like chemotaxis protein
VNRTAAHDPTGASASRIDPLDILLVDDEPLVLRVLCRMLKRDGHRVHTAAGGQDGIDAMTRAVASAAPFDLVVTDLGMPGVDGFHVARAVKAASPATPVMLLTGWGHGLGGDGGPHVDRVLAKPPRLADLRAALAALVKAPTLDRDPVR